MAGQKEDTSKLINVHSQGSTQVASSSTNSNTPASDLSAQPTPPVISHTPSASDADEILIDDLPSETSAGKIHLQIDTLQVNDAPNEPVLASATTAEDTPGQIDASIVTPKIVEPTISTTTEASEEPQPSKKRGRYKAKNPEGNSPVKKPLQTENPAVATPNQTLPPFPYGPPYATYIQPQYQVPYYIPPYYSIAPPAPATSTSHTTLQTPSAQNTYPYPHPFGHYPPYGSRPYPLQQPYGHCAYLPQCNPSQPHLQPYGPSVFTGQPPHPFVPPPNSQIQKSKTSKLIQRRKRKRLDQEQELPAAQGSISYTSVFLASSPSPDPAPDVTPVSPSQGSHRQDEQEVVAMVIPEQANTTVTRRCANQTCHRDLPEGNSGALCERCRMRMKKRQDKAKKRFKLEPWKLAIPPCTLGQQAAPDATRLQ